MSLNPVHAARSPITDAWTPAQLEHLDALVAACALVSHADGWVTAEERARMLERMRGLAVFAVFGVEDALEAFEALGHRFEQDPEAARFDAEMAVRRMRGRDDAARVIVNTACAVAVADGGFDAEEREALLRLCQILALDPIQFELITPRGVR
jgi:tellurite resistance protein TerB